MLLPGRGSHLSALVRRRWRWGTRWWLALWLSFVLAAHLGLAWHWGQWQPMVSAPPPRLSVQLTQAMRATPAPAPVPRTVAELSPAVGATVVAPAEPAASTPVAEPPSIAASEASAPLVTATAPAAAEPASAPASAARHAREGTDAPGPEWPLSTQLRYTVVGHVQGPVHGDAEVEWLRQGARYQVRLRVGIGPRLTPFGQRRLVSAGRITPRGIAPERYDEETQILWRTPRGVSVRFEGGEVVLAQGQRQPAPGGVQDSASQFVHLTWLLLTGREPARAGHVITVPLALPSSVGPWRYEVVGEDRLDTGLGPVQAWHLRPQAPLPANALAAQVWLAPSYQYLPVQIRIEQGDGLWLLLTLAAPPLQEATTPDNPSTSKENPP